MLSNSLSNRMLVNARLETQWIIITYLHVISHWISNLNKWPLFNRIWEPCLRLSVRTAQEETIIFAIARSRIKATFHRRVVCISKSCACCVLGFIPWQVLKAFCWRDTSEETLLKRRCRRDLDEEALTKSRWDKALVWETLPNTPWAHVALRRGKSEKTSNYKTKAKL